MKCTRLLRLACASGARMTMSLRHALVQEHAGCVCWCADNGPDQQVEGLASVGMPTGGMRMLFQRVHCCLAGNHLVLKQPGNAGGGLPSCTCASSHYCRACEQQPCLLLLLAALHLGLEGGLIVLCAHIDVHMDTVYSLLVAEAPLTTATCAQANRFRLAPPSK